MSSQRPGEESPEVAPDILDRNQERPAAARQVPDYLPARMVNEFTYCPRLFYYEWVEQLFADSVDTVEGSLRHEKLDRASDPLPAADQAGDERIHSRSVMLSSDTHGLIAKIDLIEGTGNHVSPIDYKRGRPREGDDGPEAWDADRAQMCAQALVLRDNGYVCDEAIVYYDASRQRVRVPIDAALVEQTLQAVAAARALAERGRIPPPLVDSPKCPRCSLVSICLPDETAAATHLQVEAHDDQLSLFPIELPSVQQSGDSTQAESVRRLVPARDDLRPLYVTGHGLTIGKTGNVLQVKERGKLIQEARIGEISQVNAFGNVQLTAPAVQALCWAEKPIAHFSFGGWFYGLTQGLGLKNVFMRQDQFRRADDARFCLRIARSIIASKIRNQRTLILRNHVEPPAIVVRRLRVLAKDASASESLERLLGIEGIAARLYFQEFGGMLKVDEDGTLPPMDLDGRNRRPPRDPVNALLSFAYSLLVKDLTIVCHSVGFDPFVGFYHQPRFGRPALALDLMELFRPLVADSVVLTAVNTRMVTRGDFVHAGKSVGLTPTGRKGVIRAYEQRMDTLVTHPLFGYRVSYRRVLEIQARLLARAVVGEIQVYPGFETR